jgi:hypothetical protein
VEVFEVRFSDNIVAESEELAGDRVEFRVSNHCGAKLTIEIIAANGLEVAGGSDSNLVW